MRSHCEQIVDTEEDLDQYQYDTVIEELPYIENLLRDIHISGVETENERRLRDFLVILYKFVTELVPQTTDPEYAVGEMLNHVRCAEGQIGAAFEDMRERLEDCKMGECHSSFGCLEFSVVESAIRDLRKEMDGVMEQGKKVMQNDLPGYIENCIE